MKTVETLRRRLYVCVAAGLGLALLASILHFWFRHALSAFPTGSF